MKRMRKVTLAAWLAAGCCGAYAIDTNRLAQLEEFPVTMTFKVLGGVDTSSQTYLDLLDAHEDFNWMHSPESLWVNHPVNPSVKYSDFRTIYPDKLLTLQDAWGGSMGNTTNNYRMVNAWQGHWLYRPGTPVIGAVSAGQTVITVQDASKILANPDSLSTLSSNLPFTVVLYQRDAQGHADFDHAEQAIVTAININNNQLTLDRGEWGTTALSYANGNTYAAAHEYFWSKQWQLNMSLHCPRGGTGNLTAAEWWADEVIAGVNLTGADGIEFDVARWCFGYPDSHPIDCNNDLVVDHGWINGINSFGLGGQVALKRIRAALPDKIIQMDSASAPYGQRGYDYVNGVQLECYPSNNDYSRFSEAFLHMRLWCERTRNALKITYPFTKCTTTTFSDDYTSDGEEVTYANGDSMDHKFRVGLASACLMGMPHPFLLLIGDEDFEGDNADSAEGAIEVPGVFRWDEYFAGTLNEPNWLGEPISDLVHMNTQVEQNLNYLSTTGAWNVKSGYAMSNLDSGSEKGANVTQLPATEQPYWLPFGVYLQYNLASGVTLETNQEYTLIFDAKGPDEWTVNSVTYSNVPRMVGIKGVQADRIKDYMGVCISDEWATYQVTFFSDPNDPADYIRFGVAEQVGPTYIRNVKLYKGSGERWSREFENGLVLLNMTGDPWDRAVLSNKYHRIYGTQDVEVNMGNMICDSVTVPPYDAVFLRKVPSDVMEYKFCLLNNASCLSVKPAEESLDSNVRIKAVELVTTNTAQQWWFNQKASGDYSIHNVNSSLVMRPEDGLVDDGTAIVQYTPNQGKSEWRFIGDGEVFSIWNNNTEKSIMPFCRSLDPNIRIVQRTDDGDDVFHWRLIPLLDQPKP